MEARLATCRKPQQTQTGPWAWPVLSVTVALGVAALPAPTWAAERETQYSLHNGTIVGSSAEASDVTILIDQKNGRTWMLVQGDGAQWQEIPFASDEPKAVAAAPK